MTVQPTTRSYSLTSPSAQNCRWREQAIALIDPATGVLSVIGILQHSCGGPWVCASPYRRDSSHAPHFP